MVFDLGQEATCFKQVLDLWPRFPNRKRCHFANDRLFNRSGLEACGIQPGMAVKDREARQSVPFACFEVVEVVPRCDLDDSRAKFPIYQDRITDDRNVASRERQLHPLSDQMIVAGIFRMDGDGGVAKHGFGPGRCHHETDVRVISHRVLDMIEFAFCFLVLNFNVGQSGEAAGTPINQSFAPVDETIFMKPDEHLTNCLGEALIHRETEPGPIAGGPQSLQL